MPEVARGTGLAPLREELSFGFDLPDLDEDLGGELSDLGSDYGG